MWQLKPGQETFVVMSGSFEGRTYMRGVVYTEIPDGYRDRFKDVAAEPRQAQESWKRSRPAPSKKTTPADAAPAEPIEK